MKLSEIVAHGGPSGAKAIGVIKWRPLDGVSWTTTQRTANFGSSERTDYLVETRPTDFVLVNHGVSATVVRWDQVDFAEVWYW